MSTITPKPLIESQYAPSTDTILYTVPANTTAIVDHFTACNSSAGAVTLTIHLVPRGGSVDNSNILTKATSLAAGATYIASEMQSQILSTGAQIVVSASAATSISVRCSGREVS